MIDPAMLQSISYAAASVSVVVAASYYALALRNANRTRQTELFMKLYDRWSEKGFQKQWMDVIYQCDWKDYDDFMRKYGTENIEAYASFFSVLAYFEGIGVLVKRKLIDIELVDDLMSTSILWYWEKTAPIVIESRKRYNRPQLVEWSEYLYSEMSEREKQLARTSKKAR